MNKLKDSHDDVNFQTEYVVDIAKNANYGYDLDSSQQLHDWQHHRHEDILTYRVRSHASKFTGKQAPIHHTKFMKAFDDSMATYLDPLNPELVLAGSKVREYNGDSCFGKTFKAPRIVELC